MEMRGAESREGLGNAKKRLKRKRGRKMTTGGRRLCDRISRRFIQLEKEQTFKYDISCALCVRVFEREGIFVSVCELLCTRRYVCV